MEAVQIVGRFRQEFNSSAHMANINSDIKFQTHQVITYYLNGCRDSYNQIKLLHDAAVDSGQKDSNNQVLMGMTFSKYIRPDGEIDWLKIDNKLDEEMARLL